MPTSIDLQLHQDHGGNLIDDAAKEAGGTSRATLLRQRRTSTGIAPSVHVATASRDGHQACQDAIALATGKSLGSGLRGQRFLLLHQTPLINAMKQRPPTSYFLVVK